MRSLRSWSFVLLCLAAIVPRQTPLHAGCEVPAPYGPFGVGSDWDQAEDRCNFQAAQLGGGCYEACMVYCGSEDQDWWCTYDTFSPPSTYWVYATCVCAYDEYPR
jgi:hypothetical protein